MHHSSRNGILAPKRNHGVLCWRSLLASGAGRARAQQGSDRAATAGDGGPSAPCPPDDHRTVAERRERDDRVGEMDGRRRAEGCVSKVFFLLMRDSYSQQPFQQQCAEPTWGSVCLQRKTLRSESSKCAKRFRPRLTGQHSSAVLPGSNRCVVCCLTACAGRGADLNPAGAVLRTGAPGREGRHASTGPVGGSALCLLA